MPFPAGAIYPDATPDAVQAAAARFGPRFIDAARGDLLLSFHCFVVRTPQHTILVDTCVGNDKPRAARPHWHMRSGGFLTALAQAGVRPEDVDFVMCTHLHADHVGWNTRLVDGVWKPTFPRAQYVMAETEYTYWHDRHATEGDGLLYGSFADSVLPVGASGQAVMVPSNHSVAPGVALEPAPGHTPGNVILHVMDANQHAILCGDVLHHPIQLLHPAWSTRFCTDPAQSRETRKAFVERFAGSDTRVLAAHFQAPTGGRIVRDGSGYGFQFDGE